MYADNKLGVGMNCNTCKYLANFNGQAGCMIQLKLLESPTPCDYYFTNNKSVTPYYINYNLWCDTQEGEWEELRFPSDFTYE